MHKTIQQTPVYLRAFYPIHDVWLQQKVAHRVKEKKKKAAQRDTLSIKIRLKYGQDVEISKPRI